VLVAIAVLSASGDAHADPEGRAAAMAAFARAEAAANERRFADAAAAYEAAVAADATAPCVPAARARLGDLAAHSEGGFAPLAELESVRRDPARMHDRDAVETLARDLEAFPPGRVRQEARLAVAHAFQQDLGDPVRAIAAYEGAVRDVDGDRLLRSVALAELWMLRRQRGEIVEAAAFVAVDPTLAPSVTAAVKREIRRSRLGTASTAILGALFVVFAASVARLAWVARDVRDLPGRIVPPFAVALGLYLGGAGALLVRTYGDSDARPFLWFGVAVVALWAAARAFVLAVRPRLAAARVAWVAACFAGVLAAAFLALQRTDPSYLDGIGL
jgi:tetratricopeptide (TPR) repeat protein